MVHLVHTGTRVLSLCVVATLLLRVPHCSELKQWFDLSSQHCLSASACLLDKPRHFCPVLISFVALLAGCVQLIHVWPQNLGPLSCTNSVSEANAGKLCLRHAKLPILGYLLCPSTEDPSLGNFHQVFAACSWWLTKNSSYKIPQLEQCFSIKCLLLLLVRSYGFLTENVLW